MWLLVGNTFDIQAVFNPASLKPTAALKPEPPAPKTTKITGLIVIFGSLILTIVFYLIGKNLF